MQQLAEVKAQHRQDALQWQANFDELRSHYEQQMDAQGQRLRREIERAKNRSVQQHQEEMALDVKGEEEGRNNATKA